MISFVSSVFTEYKNKESFKDSVIECTDDYIRLSCLYILGSNEEIKSSYGKLIKNSIEQIDLKPDKKDNFTENNATHKISDDFLKKVENNFLNELNCIFEETHDSYYIRLRRSTSFDFIYKKLNRSLNLLEKITEEFFHENNNKVEIFKEDINIKNIYFIVRFYNKNKINRYSDNYNYNISYIIPEDQEQDMKLFFEEFKRNKNSFLSKNKTYAQYSKNDSAKKIDDDFFKILESDNGIKELIKIIRNPIGEETRSISDRVFSDGIVTFYIPFDYGGVSRSNECDDNIRTACFYYFAVNSLPPMQDGWYIGAILYPIMLGDSVWAVSCHYVLMVTKSNYFADKKIWFNNYRYCNSVARRAGTHIAKEMREAYLYWLRTIYEQEFMIFFKELCGVDRKVLAKKIEDISNKFELSLNIKFEILTHFFSYSCISIKVNVYTDPYGADDEENTLYFFGRRGSIFFKKQNNIFYPKPNQNETFDIDLNNDLLPAFEITQRRIDEMVINMLNFNKTM